MLNLDSVTTWFRAKVDPVGVALAHPDRLRFNYISGSTRPDIIEVWLDDHCICQYAWINGVEAANWSKLGRLHALFEASRTAVDLQARENDFDIGTSGPMPLMDGAPEDKTFTAGQLAQACTRTGLSSSAYARLLKEMNPSQF